MTTNIVSIQAILLKWLVRHDLSEFTHHLIQAIALSYNGRVHVK
ncbi:MULTISPECIES: hypothetical protein [Nostocales]|nr:MULTISPECIES: hypothetical protein [Nostocales]